MNILLKPHSVADLPVHGEWGSWLEWSSCSRTCGRGERERKKKCDSPAPANQGKGCFGRDFERETCITVRCSVGNYINYLDCFYLSSTYGRFPNPVWMVRMVKV